MQIRLFFHFKSYGVFNKDVEIVPNIFSDHSAITLSMSSVVTETKSGPGFWKFNNSLLTDKNYLQMITTQIPEFVSKYQELTDKRLLWDLIKMEIRASTIIFAERKAKQSRNEEKELLAMFMRLQETLRTNFNETTKIEI